MNLDQAFTGIKVLAVARIVAAPFAAYQLSMHGADVIRIEHPDNGDTSRTSGFPPTPFQKAQMGHNFVAYNSNARSMTLRIDTPAGQAVFRRMAKTADVVLENLKGGTMARYGIGYEDLKRPLSDYVCIGCSECVGHGGLFLFSLGLRDLTCGEVRLVLSRPFPG